jgi:hypothetical protein
MTWDTFNQIKKSTPLLRPKLRFPIRSCKHSQCCKSTAEELDAGNLHAGFRGRPPPETRWAVSNHVPTVIPCIAASNVREAPVASRLLDGDHFDN